jgi:hypothetical protein
MPLTARCWVRAWACQLPTDNTGTAYRINEHRLASCFFSAFFCFLQTHAVAYWFVGSSAALLAPGTRTTCTACCLLFLLVPSRHTSRSEPPTTPGARGAGVVRGVSRHRHRLLLDNIAGPQRTSLAAQSLQHSHLAGLQEPMPIPITDCRFQGGVVAHHLSDFQG